MFQNTILKSKHLFKQQKSLQKSINFCFSKRYQRGFTPQKEEEKNQTIKSDYSIRSKIHTKPVELKEEDFINRHKKEHNINQGNIDYSKKIDDNNQNEDQNQEELKPANIFFLIFLIGGSGLFIQQAFQYVKNKSGNNQNTEKEQKTENSSFFNTKEENLPQNKYKKQFQNLLKQRKSEIRQKIKQIRIQISQDQDYNLGTKLLQQLFDQYEKDTVEEQQQLMQNLNKNQEGGKQQDQNQEQLSQEQKIINDIKLHPQYRNMHFLIYKEMAQMKFSQLQDLINQEKVNQQERQQENEKIQERKQQIIEQTLQYTQKFLEADKYDPEIYYVKAGVQKIQGQFEEGIKTLNTAIVLNPESMLPLIVKGLYYKESQKYDQALVCFEQVININPQTPLGYINAAYIQKLQQKYEDAYENWQKAVNLDPKYQKLANKFPKLENQNKKE